MRLTKVASRYSLVAVFLAALVFIGSGISHISVQAQGPAYGGTLIVNHPAEALGLDPTINTAVAIDIPIYNNVYEGLVKFSRTGEIVMGVAESYDISDDGLEYTFYLREGVKFHDGHELTADDVIYTLERDQQVAPHAETFYKIIEEMEAVDKYTVVLRLSDRDSLLLFNLARPDSVVIPEGAGDELKDQPNGTGPFKFVEWVPGDHVTLERFADYYGVDQEGNKLPYLDEVIFKWIQDPAVQLAALEAGDVDVIHRADIFADADRIEAAPEFKVIASVTTSNNILSTNNSREPFNDKRVRQAMSYAINREELNEACYFGRGIPMGSHMSPVNPNYVDLTWLYPYDPDKAQELLAEAGYPNGFKSTLQLAQPYANYRCLGEIIAAQLAEVGIELEISLIEWGQWIDRVFLNSEYDLTVMGHGEAFDIDIYTKPTYYFQYHNPWFNEIIRKAKRTPDPVEQKKLYAIAQWILADDAVNGFLFIGPLLVAMKEEVMNWWEGLPVPCADVTEVWIAQ